MFWKVSFYLAFAVQAAALAAILGVLIQDHLHPFLPIRDEARIAAFCLDVWACVTWALHAGGRQMAAVGMAATGALAIVSAAASGWFLLVWLPSVVKDTPIR